MEYPLVYILILNWKSAEDTIGCVETIQKLDYRNYRILLVDNGSPDDSEKILRAKFPDLAFIQTGKNLGYAGANNQGIRYAVERGAEFVWILNPDVRAHAASLGFMMNAMQQDSSIGVCGPRLQNGVGAAATYVDGVTYEKNRFEAILNSVPTLDAKAPEIKYVSDVLGCSMLIRKEVFQQIGLIREDFFLYLEETDFNFRAQAYGWKIAVSPRAINVHERKRVSTNLDRFYFRRNEMLFARIHRRFLGTAVIWSLALEKVGPYLKRRKYREAAWHLRRPNVIAFLAGCFTPIKGIPRL